MMIDVRDHGAVGDGVHKDHGAINAAIRAAAESGGGVVHVPAGTWRCGTVVLASHVTLDLSPGATLRASDDPDDFPAQPADPAQPPHLVRNAAFHHLLLIRDAEDVRVTGTGVIDGNVGAFRPAGAKPEPFKWIGSGGGPRPRPMVEVLRSRDVTLEGVTLRESPGWTCHLCCCDRVRVHGVKLFNHPFAGASDGFDVDGCRDVTFTACHIETGDDCIVVKTCRGARSSERITVTGCLLRSSCAAFKVGTETWHDVRHITIANCVVTRSGRAVQVFSMDGATVEDITVTGLVVDTDSSIVMNRPIHIDCTKRMGSFIDGVDHEAMPVGRIRRVSISDVTLNTDGRILLTGTARPLAQIALRGITMKMPWIEDPAALEGIGDRMQSSAGWPEARHARAALVAAGIDGLRVSDFTIAWPDGEPLPDDFQPKAEQGAVMFDPRTSPQPAFSAMWMRKVNGCVDTRGLTASVEGHAVMDTADCRLD